MKKNVSLLFAGIVVALTLGVAHVNASKAPVSVDQAEVILGHRIGPQGQEMLVYAE